MMFNTTKMAAVNWEGRWRGELRAFVTQQEGNNDSNWAPKLNDQDIFNAVISLNPEWAAPLPCEWNLQYHAMMNARRLCKDGALNCPESMREGIFVCPRHPACVRAFHVAELSRQRRFVLCVVLGVHEAAAYGVVASTVLHRPEDCKRQTIADMVAAHSVGASECASAYPTTARRPRRART